MISRIAFLIVLCSYLSTLDQLAIAQCGPQPIGNYLTMSDVLYENGRYYMEATWNTDEFGELNLNAFTMDVELSSTSNFDIDEIRTVASLNSTLADVGASLSFIGANRKIVRVAEARYGDFYNLPGELVAFRIYIQSEPEACIRSLWLKNLYWDPFPIEIFGNECLSCFVSPELFINLNIPNEHCDFEDYIFELDVFGEPSGMVSNDCSVDASISLILKNDSEEREYTYNADIKHYPSFPGEWFILGVFGGSVSFIDFNTVSITISNNDFINPVEEVKATITVSSVFIPDNNGGLIYSCENVFSGLTHVGLSQQSQLLYSNQFELFTDDISVASVGFETGAVAQIDPCGTNNTECPAPENLSVVTNLPGPDLLTWDQVPGAIGYEIYFSVGGLTPCMCKADVGNPIEDIIYQGVSFDNSFPIPSNFEQGCFAWAVRAICVIGLESEKSAKACYPGNLKENTKFKHVAQLEDANDFKVQLRPNPVVDELQIYVDHEKNDLNPYQLEILDMFGRKVFSDYSETAITHVPTGQLLNGIYFLVLDSGSRQIVKRFIKDSN